MSADSIEVEAELPKKSEMQVYPISMGRCLAKTQSRNGSNGIGGMTTAKYLSAMTEDWKCVIHTGSIRERRREYIHRIAGPGAER